MDVAVLEHFEGIYCEIDDENFPRIILVLKSVGTGLLESQIQESKLPQIS